MQRPEYLAVGDRILFREGRTKGLGIVKSVGYDEARPLNPNAEGRWRDGVAGGTGEAVGGRKVKGKGGGVKVGG